MKRNILLFFINAAVILFLITFENKFNITGISIGYVYAMIFCKKNPFTLFIPYVSLSIVFTFTLSNIFYTLLSVLPIIILSVFHYYFNKKYKLWVTVLLVMVSQTIKFYLYDTYVDQIISMTLAAVFFYICVVFLYPFTVKGIRRELSNFEKTCLYICVGTIGGGIYIFSLLPFSLFYAIATGVTIILSYFDKQKILPVILSMGLGASLFSLTFLPLGYCVVLSFLYILSQFLLCKLIQNIPFLNNNFGHERVPVPKDILLFYFINVIRINRQLLSYIRQQRMYLSMWMDRRSLGPNQNRRRYLGSFQHRFQHSNHCSSIQQLS